ncbi:unnamed protein product, partial [Polarella glacialis]
ESVSEAPAGRLGEYVLIRTAFVSPDLMNLSPDDEDLVDELEADTVIQVIEVVDLVEEKRVRARLAEPAGWITLVNTETGARWARRPDEADEQDESDEEDADPEEEESEDENEEDSPGLYLLTRTAFVSPDLHNMSPSDDELVDELVAGTQIRIAEIVDLEDKERVRARLVEPAGWITLLNTASRRRWAKKLEVFVKPGEYVSLVCSRLTLSTPVSTFRGGSGG